MVVALAIVGAAAVVACSLAKVTLLLLTVVPSAPATADPMLMLVIEVETPAVPKLMLPGLARAQLAALPHGYLVVHTGEVGPMLETAGRRRWLGRALVEAGKSAESATIAVGESEDGSFLVATVAFAYRTGDEAEAALKQLTERQGDFEALGFAARPGADRLTRQTKLLVVRFDIETDLVLQALGRR